MRTERIFAALGFALVTLGIAAPFLPARGMTLNQCKRARTAAIAPTVSSVVNGTGNRDCVGMVLVMPAR